MKKIYLIALCLFGVNTFAQKKLIVDVPNKVSEIQPTMWGVFFEDINMGADGGIYAELIKNRSFEFFKPLMGWNIEYPLEAKKEILVKLRHEGEILVQNRMDKNTANPRYITISVNDTKKGELGISNEGFRGMGFKSGLRYDFSVLARVITGSVKMHIELLNAKNEVIGSTLVTSSSNEWTKLESSFNALASEAKGTFRIWFEGTGVLDLDMISLFPSDTWKGRKGGMRADMIQLLADMKPGFVRFPGGCIVEGFDLNNRYQWKKTLGPIEEIVS